MYLPITVGNLPAPIARHWDINNFPFYTYILASDNICQLELVTLSNPCSLHLNKIKLSLLWTTGVVIWNHVPRVPGCQVSSAYYVFIHANGIQGVSVEDITQHSVNPHPTLLHAGLSLMLAFGYSTAWGEHGINWGLFSYFINLTNSILGWESS